jgi:cytochrome c peroxidase
MSIAKTIVTVCVLATGLLVLTWTEPTQAQSLSARADLDRIKGDYRRPTPRPIENQALVELGRDLFFDPRISASGKTACASCHFPELGYVVTDAHPRNDSGKPTSRKSQPLIGLGFAGNAPVGWDGRSPTLEAQAKTSIATGSMSMRETETPVKVEVIEERVRSALDYVAKFSAALPGKPIDARWSPGLLRSIAGSGARRRRSPNRPSAGSGFSPERPAARRAIAAGDLPMTNSTISALRRPIRAVAARPRTRC